MNRRKILQLAGLGLTAPLLSGAQVFAASARSNGDIKALQGRWRKFYPQNVTVIEALPKVERAAQDWKKALPQDAFQVLFQEDTERAFTSVLNDEKRPGVFVCRACDLPLFTSEMKYDSGTGWPSFFTAIPGHLETKTDFKLIWPRTEYHCVKCGGHQGHIFDDGPEPTAERWCNNGVALRFIAGS